MLKINKWERWQSFRKDRGAPPWIKLHRCLMTNPDWAMLSDAEKGQMVSLWIIAADKGGELPCGDPVVLCKIAQLDAPPNIPKFIKLGFLTTTCQPDDNHLSTTCQPDDAPEESRVEKRREEERRVTTVNSLPDVCVSFSKDFYSYLSDNGGKKNPTKKDLENGASTVDKLIRLDGWDLETEIKPALRWAVSDEFWSKNVRSISPLRKKSKNGETKFFNLFGSFSTKDVKTKKGASGYVEANGGKDYSL